MCTYNFRVFPLAPHPPLLHKPDLNIQRAAETNFHPIRMIMDGMLELNRGMFNQQ
jgi:hypothetical protein